MIERLALVGVPAFLAVFWAYITITEDTHWRRNSAMTFAFGVQVVGAYLNHDGLIGFSFGVLLSLLGYIMWLGTPPHRKHVKKHADRYGTEN